MMTSYGPLHMDMPVLVDQQELAYNISVQKQEAVDNRNG